MDCPIVYRFDPLSASRRFFNDNVNDSMYAALELIDAAIRPAGISMLEATIRWTQHHSVLDASCGDAMLLGVSRIEQLAPVMDAATKGPLPKAVVDAYQQAHAQVSIKGEYYLQYGVDLQGTWRARM